MSPALLAYPRSRAFLCSVFALIGLTIVASALAQTQNSNQGSSRQVTLFAIQATPGATSVDSRLKGIEPQLRKLFPGYGFKFLATDSKRLTTGQAVTCKLRSGFVAGAEMLQVLDGDGNVQFRFALDYQGRTEFATIVRTPPNQLFFCDKSLPDGTRLLIGLGGR